MIIVTGFNGFVGKNVVQYFLKKGYDVQGITRNDVELSDYQQTKNFFKNKNIETLIHCAAFTNVNQCEILKNKAYQDNVTTTKNINDLLPENTKIIFISSDYVYKNENKIHTENSAVEPLSFYSQTKIEAENIIQKRNNFCIMRTTGIYGLDYPNGKNFLMQVLNMKNLVVSTTQINNPTYVGLLCQYIEQVINKNLNGIYNACGIEYLSRYSFAEKIKKVFNNIPTANIEQNKNIDPLRPLYCATSIEKIIKDSGIIPETNEYYLKVLQNEYKK